MITLHHIGISGGKDSSALLLWAIHESGLPRESLRVTFCDTGNEDDLTYEHLQLIDRTVIKPAGIIGGLETLKPERDFWKLALWKKRFPSRKAQFCTQHLKLFPTQKWVLEHFSDDTTVVVLNGKRIGESAERKKSMSGKPEREWSPFWACEEWAPLMHWSIEDVLAIHRRYNLPLNPLYDLGARRVGCWPCINCGKSEIRLVSKHRPEKIDFIEEQENLHEADHGRFSSFFTKKVTTKPYRTKKTVAEDGTIHMVAPIRQVVEWSKTARGGNQRLLPFDEPKACWMNYGACE